jgi:hypothetical protein
VSGEDNGVIDGNGYVSGGKSNGASGIAQLAHGDEGGGGEFGDDVDVAGGRREHRQVEVCFMCQSHDHGTVGGADGDRIEREAFVDDRGIDGSEVGSAASICNGELIR